MSSGKLILLLIAMGIIGLVLLLGYKLDKFEEKGKRKEQTKKDKLDGEYEVEKFTELNFSRNDYKDEINQTNAFCDFYKSDSNREKYKEEFDKTAVIEKINLSKLESIEDFSSNKKVYEETEIKTDIKENY